MAENSHWFITGGAGFIGSHLVRELVARGQQVSVLDDLSQGKPENLAAVKAHIRFTRGDICDFSAVSDACRGAGYVVHLAALTSVAGSMEKPQETLQVNVRGTLNVLEAARKNGAKRVLFASSAAVYGTRPELPYREDTPADCHSPYAWSKQAATELCRLYTRAYGLDTVVLRFFNVFGAGQNPDSPYAPVIAKFMQCAAQNKPLEIDWDGQQSRDFIHVQDAVAAILLAAQKGAAGSVYNAASGRTYTLSELADAVEKVSGRKLPRVPREKRPGDVHASAADISKIRALGFAPCVSLEQGLREIWQECAATVRQAA